MRLFNAHIAFKVVVAFLAIHTIGYGGHEERIRGLQGQGISVGTDMTVEDQYFQEIIAGSYSSDFAYENAEIRTTLFFDDRLRKYYSDDWSLSVVYDIQLIDSDEDTTVVEDDTLHISFYPTGTYQDIDLRRYRTSDFVKARLVVTEVIKSGNGASAISILPEDIHLDLSCHIDRWYILNTSDVPSVIHDTNRVSSYNELEVRWSTIEGAEHYEMEWAFIDHSDSASLPSIDTFNFSTASRIMERGNRFRISLAYPMGMFVFRVRGIGVNPTTGKRIEGPWSAPTYGDPSTDLSSDEQFQWMGLDRDRNWSYSASFAGMGLKSESIQFMDGAGRVRQAISRSNTQPYAAIASSIYDYLGRSSLSVLPAIEDSLGLTYQADMLKQGTSDYYDYRDFDLTNNLSNPAQIDESIRQGVYWNATTGIGMNNQYVPDAEGYPYARSTFWNDGSGRLRTSSGMGNVLGQSGGHLTYYYYSRPLQEELWRLFGNEVGDAGHYRKDYVIDANGQASVTYLDGHGRVIATGLIGDSPDNLEDIDTRPAAADTIDSDLMPLDVLDEVDGTSITQYPFVVTVPVEYSYDFTLAPTEFTYPCADSTVDVLYDLEVYLLDEEGDKIALTWFESGTSIGSHTTLSLEGETGPLDYSFKKTISTPGSYKLVKIISVNDDWMEGIVGDSSFYDQSCFPSYPALPINCDPSCYSLCREAYVMPVYNGYSHWLDTMGNLIGVLDPTGDFQAESGYDDSDTLFIHNNFILPCANQCDSIGGTQPDMCQIIYDNMVADMSPGGQYFDDHVFTDLGATPSNAWLSANIGTVPSAIPYSNWDDVRDNWEAAWIDELISYHPEYCHYRYQCDNGKGVIDENNNSFTLGCAEGERADYEQRMLLASMDSTDTHFVGDGQDEYLFNPIGMSTVTSTSNPSTYQPYPVPSSSLGEMEDPFHDCRSFLTDTIAWYLTNFHTDSIGNGMSIWYVLNDPDDITTGSTTTDLGTLELFRSFHGNPPNYDDGILGLDTGQISKYFIFRSVYQFYRDWADYHATDILYAQGYSPFDWTGSSCTFPLERLDSPDDNGMTASGKRILFPVNPVFETMGPSVSWEDTTEMMLGSVCQTTCESFAQGWIDDLGSCVDTLSQADLDSMRADLIRICTGSCDQDSPYGSDVLASPISIDGGSDTASSMAQVVAHYIPVACNDITHPKAIVPHEESSCSCGEIYSFLETYLDQNGLSIPGPLDLSTIDTMDYFNDFLSEFLVNGESYDSDDFSDWLDSCNLNQEVDTSSLPSVFICEDLFTPVDPVDACEATVDMVQDANQQLYVQAQMDIYEREFREGYLREAMEFLNQRQTQTWNYLLDEYHYTLYYYDQAGNLIKTIPPSGVVTLSSAQIDSAQAHAQNAATSPYMEPDHFMVTDYQFNSLGQMTQNTSPDGGTTLFFYDDLGRLVASQDAEQQARSTTDSNLYSYMFYDALGRVIEAGVMSDSIPLSDAISRDAEDYKDWLAKSVSKTEVISTYYDTYVKYDSTISELGQAFYDSYLRGRIGSITYENIDDNDPDTYDHATHYAYDYAGNVHTLLQESEVLAAKDAAESQRYKRVEYEYDLITGNVLQVHYQPGQNDQFHHKNEYDADNRLVASYTSHADITLLSDEEVWERDSKQFYYAHGPLARMELGDMQVQGKDFAYTINGWMRGVNSSLIGADLDRGYDGHTDTVLNHRFARDAFAYSLHYYQGDHKSVGGVNHNVDFNNTDINTATTSGASLYNGNIRSMVVSLTDDQGNPIAPLANAYRYDQLNRIKRNDPYHLASSDLANNELEAASLPNTTSTMGGLGDYGSSYWYDGNGNLTNLFRCADTMDNPLPDPDYPNYMDQLDYHYWTDANGRVTNRLLAVDDDLINGQPGQTDYAVHVDSDIDYWQLGVNPDTLYRYDSKGRLILDAGESISSIEWTQTNKVKKVVYAQGADSIDNIQFDYNALDIRVLKKVVFNNGDVTETHYVVDASGHAMATYIHEIPNTGSDSLVLSDHNVYGGSRVGTKIDGVTNVVTSTVTVDAFGRSLGQKSYELANHLGNVLEVVSDRKLASEYSTTDSVDFYTADVRSWSDYYPFGMMMPGRNGNTSDYRYGFNGMESDDEVKGEGNSYTTLFRQYDPRLGRWLSLDPKMMKYPSESPYAAFHNNPVFWTDPFGDDPPPGATDPHLNTRNAVADVVTYKEVEDMRRAGNNSWNPNVWYTKGAHQFQRLKDPAGKDWPLYYSGTGKNRQYWKQYFALSNPDKAYELENARRQEKGLDPLPDWNKGFYVMEELVPIIASDHGQYDQVFSRGFGPLETIIPAKDITQEDVDDAIFNDDVKNKTIANVNHLLHLEKQKHAERDDTFISDSFQITSITFNVNSVMPENFIEEVRRVAKENFPNIQTTVNVVESQGRESIDVQITYDYTDLQVKE